VFFPGPTLWESVGCKIIFLRKAVRGKNGFDFISPSAEGETLRGFFGKLYSSFKYEKQKGAVSGSLVC
jgi:hypothetical protein